MAGAETGYRGIAGPWLRLTVAEHGLSAPTAAIAKEAGVSNGTLFNTFATKADLLNHLFVELKADLGAALTAPPADDGTDLRGTDLRGRAWRAWCRWVDWGTADPGKKRVLAQLSACNDITPASCAAGERAMAGVAAFLDQVRGTGALRDAPRSFVVSIAEALADTTIAFMTLDPGKADEHRAAGFEALWNAVTR